MFVQAVYSSYSADGVKTGEATVFSTEGQSNFETQFFVDGSEGARTGVAVANNSDAPRTYSIAFSHSNGISTGTINMPARTSQAACFNEMMAYPPGASGVVEIESPGGTNFGPVAFRYTGPVFTTIPANPKGMAQEGGMTFELSATPYRATTGTTTGSVLARMHCS